MELKDIGHYEDRTKTPRVLQLGHSYSAGCYAAQPNAVMNRRGTRVYFTSRWNYDSSCDYSTDIYDTYIIELPLDWHKDL